MTIDIKIGRLIVRPFDKVMKEKLDQLTFTYKDTLDMMDFLEIEECPKQKDGCSGEDTIFPNQAYRSGSISGMHEFFELVMPKLVKEIRPISSNDAQISKLKPFLPAINKLKYGGKVVLHKKRLQWLKFWSNKAVELYDEDAAIQFS